VSESTPPNSRHDLVWFFGRHLPRTFADKIRSAARTRSVTVSSGLAEMKSSEGTLIAFATGPGQKALDGKQGENSPFTRALLKNIAEPGVEIRHALTKVRAQVSEETNKRQLPWENTNLTGFFYFNQEAAPPVATTGTGAPGTAVASPATQTNASNDIELEFWRSVRNSDKLEEYSAYLARFPSGNFTGIARARIAALQAGTGPRSADETQSIATAAPRARPKSNSDSISESAAISKGDCQRSATSEEVRTAISRTLRVVRSSSGRRRGAIRKAGISTNCSMTRC